MSEIMDITIADLLKVCGKYLHKEENIDLIRRSYTFACLKHDGQMRKSGEPYISHPLNVAYILADLKVGPETIAAALLHDIIEDTGVTHKDLAQNFSEDIAFIVEGVTKISKLKFDSVEKNMAENHQKMLIAMSQDIRIIFIKLADRLHNLRTMDAMPRESQIRKAKETLEIYAPLAHKLGMFKIKAELEDRALRYENPDIYYHISNLISAKKSEREALIDEMIASIEQHFKSIKIRRYEIKGRIKNIYSIYNKMYENNRDFDDIYDLLAIRIIVNNVEACYQALGIIHAHYVPLPKRFKDYIAVPKANLYQSLHTTVIGVKGEIFEIQIRTREMDQVAEVGVAAHWAYKEKKIYSRDREQYEIASKLKWYGELLSISNDSDINTGAQEFVETFKTDLLNTDIYVYTPKNEVIDLPMGATVLDYAYKIHTDVGNNAVGATINGKQVNLDTELHTGDMVSIKTSPTAPGPNEFWLKKVTTNHAKAKIKSYLNTKNKDQLIANGKADIEKEIIQNKISVDLSDEFVRENFSKFVLSTVEELYFEVGKKVISPKTVAAKLLGKEYNFEENLQRQIQKNQRKVMANKDTGVVVTGLNNAEVKLGNCCNCIPGDKICGYVSKGNGLIIHHVNCKNIANFEKERFVDVYWQGNIDKKFPARIKIISENNNSFTDIISTINACNSSILSIQANQQEDFTFIVKLKVMVKNINELENILANLRKVKHIVIAERDNN